MKTLEKWYVWDGIKPLPINSVKTLDASGAVFLTEVCQGELMTWQTLRDGCYVLIDGHRQLYSYDTIAYTLGEQVESKRVCKACNGYGVLITHDVSSNIFTKYVVCKCKRGAK
jgi:hypothetical protein